MTVLLALLAQGPTNFPSGGADELERLLSAFYLLWGGGFALAVLGRLFDSRILLTTGIGLVFVGTGVFFAAVGIYG